MKAILGAKIIMVSLLFFTGQISSATTFGTGLLKAEVGRSFQGLSLEDNMSVAEIDAQEQCYDYIDQFDEFHWGELCQNTKKDKTRNYEIYCHRVNSQRNFSGTKLYVFYQNLCRPI